MQRILFVYHVSTVGGGSYCLLNLLKAINRKYFEPIVLLPKKGPLCVEISNLGIEIVYLPSLALYPYNKSIFNFKTIQRIKQVHDCMEDFSNTIKSIKPDIVYFNSMMLFPFLRLAKENRCKTVLHVREHWPHDEHIIQLGRIRKEVYAYTDKLIAINHYSASIFPEISSTLVYDWIDMTSRKGGSTLQSILKDSNFNGNTYLYTGGIQKIKGAHEVIKTFSENIKGGNKRLIALGLDVKLEMSGLKGIVKIILSKLGYKTYSERVLNLCKNDKRIICIPAEYNITDLLENVTGLVSFFTIPHANLALAESIILQTPAIAARTSESLEYSNDGELAILYELGDIEAFKDAWLELDSNYSNLQDRLKDRSYIIADKFNIDNNAKTFNDALLTLV